MRSTGWLPVAILIVVVASLGFSWVLYSTDLDYLFDGDQGMLRPEVANWWRLWLPVVAAGGFVAAMVSIATLRCLRERTWSEIPGITALGLLGLIGIPGALFYLDIKAEPSAVPCEKPIPQSASGVFHPTQWRALATYLRWNDKPPLFRTASAGIEGHVGVIPYDPNLLQRLTFVGLTRQEVEEILGPGKPPTKDWHPAGLRYYMRGSAKSYESASLFLRTGESKDPEAIVLSEYLSVGSPGPVCGFTVARSSSPYR